MARGVLALTVDNELSYCTAPPERRGIGRCNHKAHQEIGESKEDFILRVSDIMLEDEEPEVDGEDDVEEWEIEDEPTIVENPIGVEDIAAMKNKIFEIAGRDDITPENLKEVLDTLPLEKQREIMSIGFECSKYFAFPITTDNYEQENLRTKIYFSNMGDFGLGAKKNHINEILGEIGTTIEEHGSGYIKNNYVNGLTDDEWWSLKYATRKASINKTVSIADPGAAARYLFYGLSDTMIIDDCQDEESTGILTCHMPGGFCEKCAAKSGMEGLLDLLKKQSESGDIYSVRIGGLISTNLSEPLTQSYLNAIHGANDPKANQHKVIVSTYSAFSKSPIIAKAMEGQTTLERRELLKEGLKEAYADQGIEIDEYNIDIVAKKMTSYKKDRTGLRFVEEGELCDIVSVNSIGNRGNVFKKASLGSSFKTLSKVSTSNKDPYDSFEDLLGF